MYTFRIPEEVNDAVDTAARHDDKETEETEETTYIPLKTIEFVDIVTPGEGLNNKKFKEIKRPRVEKYKRKPRNMFMIFRGLTKNLIRDKLPNLTFEQKSKVVSNVSVFFYLFFVKIILTLIFEL